MTALLAGVLIASLLGSLHCIGMCGGFVAVYSGEGARFWTHGAYGGTRLIAYVALGAVAGAAGAAVNWAVAGQVAAWFAGGCMILWASISLARLAGWAIRIPRMSGLTGLLARCTGGITRRPPVVRAAILGAVSALLPCGWLYAFVVLAGGTGSPLTGALVMAVFWSGTVPGLLGLGLGLRHVAVRFGKFIPWVSAVAVLAIGLTTIVVRSHLKVEGPAKNCCSGH